jgi:hypothetical protein
LNEQDEAPVGEEEPAAQTSHLVAPMEELYFPAEHRLHEVLLLL